MKACCWQELVSKLLSVAILLSLPICGGCSSSSTDDDSASRDTGDSAIEEMAGSEEELVELEPFDPPPLAEIDATANWVDLPVLDGLEILREKLAKKPPLVSPEEAMDIKNDSPEENEKILSVISQLPESDDQVDWNASVVRCVGSDVNSMNPIMISSTVEMDLLELTGLQLIGFDVDFRPYAVKWAVKSWQTSEDRMMDKFVLRDDVTWSDGTPLTAHDVAFTYQVIMNPRVPVPAVRSNVSQLRWVHAYDDHTLIMFHREPMASWTENIQFPIIPKHIYEAHLEEDYTLQNSSYHLQYEEKPITCGPYEYVKRVRNQEIVLSRRDGYYMVGDKQVRPKPFFDEIRFKIILEPNTVLLALKSGNIDESPITAEQWRTQTNKQDFYERNTKATGLQWVEFHFDWNCQEPYFADKRVRQAMAYAFDHQEMLEKIFYGMYLPSTGVFHPTAWMASKNIEPYQQDLDKAEELLDEAGWIDSDGDGVRDKQINGRKVPFEFTMISVQAPNSIKICTLLKDNLDQIGVICHVKPTEPTVMSQLALDHKFQAMLGGWGTGTDPSTLDNIFKTGAGRNYGQYSNLRVDILFEQGQKEFDREKRAAIYAEIHEILYKDQPSLWLFYRNSFHGLNKRLRGFNFSPRGPFGVQPGFLGIWVPKP